MIERKIEVKTYMVHADCNCGAGELLPTGEAYMTYPAKYIHICKACGRTESFRDTYPKLVTEEIIAPVG